jgi:hypothetical protein
MVEDAGKAAGRRMPEPNPVAPTPVPAPEGAPKVRTTRDPVDSPQPNPQIGQERTKGLHKP